MGIWVGEDHTRGPRRHLSEGQGHRGRRGQTLQAFVTDALRDKLNGRASSRNPTGPPCMRGFGALRALKKETSRHPEAHRPRVRARRAGGSSVILDTNALSAFVDGDSSVGALVAARGHAAIPAIVLGEFRYGVAGSRHRGKYDAWLEAHLPDFEVLDVTATTAGSTPGCVSPSRNPVVPFPPTTPGYRRLRWSTGCRF